MSSKATTAVYIDKSHPKADSNKCLVYIRVTYDRTNKYFATPYSLTITDFEKLKSEKPGKQLKELSLQIQAFEKKAADIIKELPFFSFAEFEKRFRTNSSSKNTISQAFEHYVQILKNNNQIGTAVSYECANRSLGKFSVASKFTDVSPAFLKEYERWMLAQGNSITTIGIYLRNLRTLFNDQIAEGMLNKDFYPFGKKKYEIPTGNNVKKSLTLKDIAAIYYYEAEAGTFVEMAKDFWIFMYLCNGINVKDMCLLKYENIKGDILEFQRAKTARTKRKVEPIRVSLVDDLKEIIKKWGNMKEDDGTFIFPVLKKGLTSERERQLIQQLTGVINDHMKAIGKQLEIQSDCTTYAARHSFATILQRSGVSTEFISEALGHTNVKTTQSYLAGFEDESKKETVKALTAFKKATV